VKGGLSCNWFLDGYECLGRVMDRLEVRGCPQCKRLHKR